jgi:hypothetical protein
MSLLPALAKETAVTVTAGAITPVTVAAEVVTHGAERGERLAEQVGALVRELTVTAKALQRVLVAVADAVEDGFLDELRGGLRNVAVAVELMAVVNQQLEQAMPVIDATAPTLKLMNTTLAQLNGTIAQLETFPGVRIARRFVGRPGATEVF